MSDVTLIWTALPHGIDGNASARVLRLAVHVSMRLRGDAPETVLSAFPGITDWPLRLQPGEVEFDVRVDGHEPVRAALRSPAPRVDLWRALFAPSTFVRSHSPDDFTGRALSSNKMVEIQQHVKGSYQRVAAASPIRLPRSSDVASAFPLRIAARRRARKTMPNSVRERYAGMARELFAADAAGDLSRRIADLHDVANAVAREDPLHYTPVVDDDGTIEAHFAALAAFHHVDETLPRAAAVVPRLDFHDGLSALGSFPGLLPLLGLVFELEVDETGFPQSPTGTSPLRLQVLPRFRQPLAATPVTPFTAYRLEGERFFLPAPRPAPDARPDVEFGFLSLRKPDQFELIQVDVDGAGLKTLHAMMGESGDPAAGGADSRSSVPALRTSGVSVAWSAQDRTLHDKFVAANRNQQQLQAHAPDQPLVFFVEDLIRGYRVDVRAGDGAPWRSLHRRAGRFEFVAGSVEPLDLVDEGMVQHAATQPLPAAGGPPGGTLRVQDSIAHWQGWSLSVPRPGRSIVDGTQSEDVVNGAVAGSLPLACRFKVEPGSLPRLRFGMKYQFRARAVDLAGNSWSTDEADTLFAPGELTAFGTLPVLPGAGEEFSYRRFEPVPAPVLAPRARFTDGESLERLVIRSAAGTPASAYAADLSARFGGGYLPVCERHIVPPKGSLWLAEMHGRFDASFGRAPGETDDAFQQRCERTYRIAAKEAGTLLDDAVVDSTTGQPVSIPPTDGSDSVLIVEMNPGAASPAPGEAPPGRYAIHREAQLRVPYLPDPLAHGAALFGLPGVPGGMIVEMTAQEQLDFQPLHLPDDMLGALGSITHVPFGPADLWPQRLPFRLQIFEPGQPDARIEWDAGQRVLRVPLPKAETAIVRLSAYLREPADIELLGMWRWMQDNAPPGVPAPSPSLAQVAIAGGAWMLTPYREIALVHAVQRPLAAPAFTLLRQRLAENVQPLLAAHPELQGPFGAEVLMSDQQRTFALLMGELGVHGKSTARVDIVADWNEPADAPEPQWRAARAQVSHLDVALPDEAISLPELTEAQLAVTPGSRYIADKDKLQFSFLRHEFGDTRHRIVRYTPSATTRFRDYFPAELANDPGALTIRGEPSQPISILSRARPAPPNVLYVLPTFGWSTEQNAAGAQTRTRAGNGLRVYLGRPWFSSGAGELLGVVLAPAGTEERLEHCVTTWGRDPAWVSAPAALSLQHGFARAVASMAGVPLDEADAPARTLVRVVGHAVEWDDERKLWFADVQIDLGPTYFPFVRLALARFQPDSIADAYLSRVTLADVTQIAPDRKVTITPTPGDPDRFAITVEGLTYRSGAWRAGAFEVVPQLDVELSPVNEPGALVRVSVQERIPGTRDDSGWRNTDEPIGIEATSAILWNSDPAPGTPLWTGNVALPHGRAPGRFRVLIAESEHWITDHVQFKTEDVPTPDPDPDRPPHHGPHHPTTRVTRTFYPGAGRLVFADAIEL